MRVNQEQIDTLKAAAKAVRENAYCPYSHFAVGAALLCPDGRVYTGANFENAAFGAGTCAERVALGKALSDGQRSFTALAVCGKGAPTPCGICRQALLEFGDMDVISFDSENNKETFGTLQEYLPKAFSEF